MYPPTNLPPRLLGLAAMLLVVNLRPVASARPYEVFIDVDDEDDLYDLRVTDAIGDETFEVLVDLMRSGIDLNTATRQELYTLPNVTHDDVDAILAHREAEGPPRHRRAWVQAGVLDRRTMQSIAAFISAPTGARKPGRGRVRARTIWTSEDRRAPPMVLEARWAPWRRLELGAVALLERNRLAPVTWDPNRDALVSTGPRSAPRLPKLFVQWDAPTWAIVAGTYAIGFGQRLVFDTTGRSTPNGLTPDAAVDRSHALTTSCRESAGERTEAPCRVEDAPRVTPDFVARERQRGIAGGIKRIEMPTGWMQLYGFVSYQPRSIYQYHLLDRSRCERAPLDGSGPAPCSPPTGFKRSRTDPLAPASAFRFTTYPGLYRELHGGGNLSYFLNSRTHVGATAYAASVQWRVQGAKLDFQPGHRFPSGGPFGAVGVDAAWGRERLNVSMEAAHSFDAIDRGGGGGPAAIVRQTTTLGAHEIEASARYYDRRYKNPYARPIASPDATEGLRATDEAGIQLRYAGHPFVALDLRARADLWRELSTSRPKFDAAVRADLRVLPWLQLGLWLDHQNRALPAPGRTPCAPPSPGATAEDNSDDDGRNCLGVRSRVTPRIRVRLNRRLSAAAQVHYAWPDRSSRSGRGQPTLRITGLIAASVLDALRLRMRVAWNRSETLWAYAQAEYRAVPWLQPSVRYDVRAWLDARASTRQRRPNPEHWLLLQLVSRF